MVVVADTSPVNCPILIGHINLLRQLYTRILVPPAVLRELKHPLAPELVRESAGHTPDWLEILNPRNSLILP
jgi:hypothetical protein